MDKSETYIRMCEKAWPDLKPKWKWAEGSWVVLGSTYWLKNTVTVLKEGLRKSLITSRNWEEDDFLDEDSDFPLYGQDQLQEMVRQPLENNYSLTKRFLAFIPWHPESSMEQLWLAFVMKEKYGKVWNPGDNVYAPQWEKV